MPPAPNTATDCPGRVCRVLMIAPAPVITAQPTIEVTSVGRSFGIGNTTRSWAMAYSAQVAAECITFLPFQLALYCARSLSAWDTIGWLVVALSRSTQVVIT